VNAFSRDPLHGPFGAVTGTDENRRDLTGLGTWK
jgi:hypothetical protein